jgi:hypothetical protein
MSLLRISGQPAPRVLSLLTDNTIGTPKLGMVYQHRGVLNKIGKIPDPKFVSLIRSEDVIGTCCFCQRVTYNTGVQAKSFYIRYFSFAPAYRRTAQQSQAEKRPGILSQEIENLLSGEGLANPADKFFHYAYYDPSNLRSVKLCKQFGFEEIRAFSTIMFTRLILRRVPSFRFEELKADQRPQMLKALRSFYAGYSMFCEENLFSHGRYYVAKDADGKILAGLQVSPDQWKIHSLAGRFGKVAIGLISGVPFLNKIVNRNFRFLSIEGIYLKNGEEPALAKLIESVLHLHRHHVALTFVDSESTLYKVLKERDLGWVAKTQKTVFGKVICLFKNYSTAEKEGFKNRPAYISAIDVT